MIQQTNNILHMTFIDLIVYMTGYVTWAGKTEFFDTSEIERFSSRVAQYFDDTPQYLIFPKGSYISVIENQCWL